MVSRAKAERVERRYRALLYRRPIGIFSVLLFVGSVVFSMGLVLSRTNVRFPLYSLYVGTFSLLLAAIGSHWLLQAVACAKKKEPVTAVWVALLGLLAAGFGGWLLSTAIVAFPSG